MIGTRIMLYPIHHEIFNPVYSSKNGMYVDFTVHLLFNKKNVMIAMLFLLAAQLFSKKVYKNAQKWSINNKLRELVYK